MNNRTRAGFRGYIASRPVQGTSFPQRLQNLAVRDYAARIGVTYKLSATEYAMSGCYMMLASLVEELPQLEGIIAFSAFMLPQHAERRRALYARVLGAGAQLHAALENLALRSSADLGRWEDLIGVAAALPRTPFGGRYEKFGEPLDGRLARLLVADPSRV
jgi:sporadic carbohydrate cluster protein (TIGR04323 family)